MHRFMLVIIVPLFGAAQLVVPAAIAGEAANPSGNTSQIIACDNENFLGDHMHISGHTEDLGKWGNSISSMIILSETWEVFEDEDFKGTKMAPSGAACTRMSTTKALKITASR